MMMIIIIIIIIIIIVGPLSLITRDTHLLMTHGTHSHPDQPHPDFPKSTRGAPLLSGLPQEEAHDTHKHNIRTIATAHLDDRHTLSRYVCSDH